MPLPKPWENCSLKISVVMLNTLLAKIIHVIHVYFTFYYTNGLYKEPLWGHQVVSMMIHSSSDCFHLITPPHFRQGECCSIFR